MSCEKNATGLIAYLDGRAGAAERREVESHLATCAACRARAEEFRGVWKALEEIPVVEPSLGFDARIRQRIAAEPRPRPWFWLIPSPRLAFSLSLLVALSAYISSRPPAIQESAPPTEEGFKMINDLPVLEDYDVLSNFEALSELPQVPAQAPETQDPAQPDEEPVTN
jgi:anti-sigma factor RsiW